MHAIQTSDINSSLKAVTDGTDKDETMSLRAGFRRDQIRRGLGSRTIQERDKVLDSLTRWSNGVPILALSRERIEDWLDERPLSPRSRTVYLSAVHCFYAWCVDEGHLTADPTVRIRRPRLSRMVPRPIADDDLRHAIRGATPRMRAWLSLAAYEGFRCKEIAGLRREDVFQRHSPPIIRVWNGKGGHQAILPLNPDTASALNVAGCPAKGFLFVDKTGRPINPATVSALGNRYLHKMGIEATMHQLRHWFGTAVWAATKDLRVTQEMLRHSSPATTAGYAAFDSDLATRAISHIHLVRST